MYEMSADRLSRVCLRVNVSLLLLILVRPAFVPFSSLR
jgi:hypothetical protein